MIAVINEEEQKRLVSLLKRRLLSEKKLVGSVVSLVSQEL